MPDALRLLVGTFLAVPVPAPRRVDRRTAGVAMVLAPLTALPTALLWAGLALAVTTGHLPALVGGALAVAVPALLSRGMHLDGLADTADGLASGHDPERALTVMRRGDTGPNGAAALVLSLVTQAACLGALLGTRAGTGLAVVAVLASRLAPAVACRRGLPAARPGGLGAGVADTVATPALVGAVAAVAALAGGIGVVTGPAWYAGPLVTLVAAGAAWETVRRCVSRFGGITGDVVGAAIELALVGGLVTATVLAA